MKYLVFSFDDGRMDTFTKALPILERFGYHCTINIITDFVLNPQKYLEISPPIPMSKEMIVEAQTNGHEVSCHGHKHTNTIEDVRTNIEFLKSFGLDEKEKLGFASPFSCLNDENCSDIYGLIESGELLYIRSGLQTRRESVLFKLLYIFQLLTKSRYAFWRMYKKNIAKKNDERKLLYGVTITNRTTPNQIKYFLKMMPEESVAILILHSISESKADCKSNKWCWYSGYLSELCEFLNANMNISVITQREVWGE